MSEMNWLNVGILTLTPIAGIIGAFTTKLTLPTALFAVFYYYVTGLGAFDYDTSIFLAHCRCIGITAGYHRLWAHRSYNASKPLQYFLALVGAGAVEGSIKWWSRGHRAHHRYTDTDLDPYNAHKGLLWSHVGWMMVKPRRKPGVADVTDLTKNKIVRWQHRYYLWLVAIMAFLLPTIIPWLGWGDAQGGYVYAGVLRLCFVHHASFLLLFYLALFLTDLPSRPSV
jgi:stearoyl-CoA desaturase (delta-9 desaturase)